MFALVSAKCLGAHFFLDTLYIVLYRFLLPLQSTGLDWHIIIFNLSIGPFVRPFILPLFKLWIGYFDKKRYEIDERYRLNQAIIVKFYHPYTQLTRNVRLSHRRIATFSGTSLRFWLLRLINTLTSLLTDRFLVDSYLWQFTRTLRNITCRIMLWPVITFCCH